MRININGIIFVYSELDFQCRRHKETCVRSLGRDDPLEEEGTGNPLQNSCLENPLARRAWWAIVHMVAKSWTWLKHHSLHRCTEKRKFYIYITTDYFSHRAMTLVSSGEKITCLQIIFLNKLSIWEAFVFSLFKSGNRIAWQTLMNNGHWKNAEYFSIWEQYNLLISI